MRPLVGLVVASLVLEACASTAPQPSLPQLDLPKLEERALLLLMVDRKLYEPMIVQSLLAGPADLRRDLAIALGRAGQPEALRVLEGLRLDDDAAVRRAAIFSLGLLKEPDAKAGLLTSAAGPVRDEAVLAVEALAKVGAPLLEVLEALVVLPEEERRARLLPSLYRFKVEGQVTLAESGLETSDPALHRWAAYALAREPKPEALPALRGLVADPDPLVRAWVARALGLVGAAADLERLAPLAAGTEAGPAIHALRSAKRLLGDTGAQASEPLCAAVRQKLDDPRPGVALSALEVAAACLSDEALAARAETGDVRFQELAVLALAETRSPRAQALVERAARSPEPTLRARAAEAAGQLGERELLAALARDPAALVRATALEARLKLASADAATLLREALLDGDLAVRATAFGALADTPVLPFETIVESYQGLPERDALEAQLGAIGALAARAEKEPLERGGIVRLLEKLAAEPFYLVRRAARDALVRLERPLVEIGRVESLRDLEIYKDILRQTAQRRTVAITTPRGSVTVELDCPAAPMTCLSFLQLAGTGFYDGQRFHRVVPDFVVQGGDPRGDGFGGPGYELRDELGPRRFERGTLGMATAGADTAGSQFFFTLSAQPHLDGNYVAFGQIVAGLDVLDRLVQGDRIERVREVP